MIKCKKNLNDKIEQITLISFIIYMLLLFCAQTSIYQLNSQLKSVFKTIRYCCYMVFIIKVLLDIKGGCKISFTIVLLGILASLILFLGHNNYISVMMLILLAIRNINNDKIIKSVFYSYFISYSFIVICSLIRIMPDWIFYRNSKIRHGLGFLYATDAMSIYLHITLMYFYIKKGDMSFIEIILFELVNIELFYYTDARMSFLLITMIIIYALIERVSKEKMFFDKQIIRKYIKIICITLPIALYLLYNFAVIEYQENNRIAHKVDKLLSGRLSYTRDAYLNYDIKLFRTEYKMDADGVVSDMLKMLIGIILCIIM